MSGVIEGGWGYVAAAWGISLALVVIYAGVLVRRLAMERRGHRTTITAAAPTADEASGNTDTAGQ